MYLFLSINWLLYLFKLRKAFTVELGFRTLTRKMANQNTVSSKYTVLIWRFWSMQSCNEMFYNRYPRFYMSKKDWQYSIECYLLFIVFCIFHIVVSVWHFPHLRTRRNRDYGLIEDFHMTCVISIAREMWFRTAHF